MHKEVQRQKADKAKGKKQAPRQSLRPSYSDKNNQWYHYSTKLELNIKHLRAHIETLERNLDENQKCI